MKLVLANNQSEKFLAFHKAIQQDEEIYEYSGYNSILFSFKPGSVDFITINNGLHAADYEAVYISGYHRRLELAVTVAIVLDSAGVRYVDRELRNTISMSKLSEYAKLAAGDVSIPASYGGTATALLEALAQNLIDTTFPLILKRADADRGVDNFKVSTPERLREVLSETAATSTWILQEFIENDGFYRFNFYDETLSSVVFRAKYDRPDGNIEKQHLNKPNGGQNASLVELSEVSTALKVETLKATKVANRQFAGVDVLVDADGKPYILEVNNTPQLVTVTAFKDVRHKGFLDAIKNL